MMDAEDAAVLNRIREMFAARGSEELADHDTDGCVRQLLADVDGLAKEKAAADTAINAVLKRISESQKIYYHFGDSQTLELLMRARVAANPDESIDAIRSSIGRGTWSPVSAPVVSSSEPKGV